MRRRGLLFERLDSLIDIVYFSAYDGNLSPMQEVLLGDLVADSGGSASNEGSLALKDLRLEYR